MAKLSVVPDPGSQDPVDWYAPLGVLAGGDAAKIGKALGVDTVGHLLSVYPRSYVAKGSLSELDELTEGDHLTMVGRVRRCDVREYRDRRTGRPATRLEVWVDGADGDLRMTWFDKRPGVSQWRAEQMPAGSYGYFAGKLRWWQGRWELTNPQSKIFSIAGDAEDAFDQIPDLIPIYRSASGIDSWVIGDTIAAGLRRVSRVPDVLPEDVRTERGLLDARTALSWIHRPDDNRQLGAARKRLKLDEAFVTQVVLAQRRHAAQDRRTTTRTGGGGLLEAFDARLPFELTEGQREVCDQLLDELARPHPMHRLLQGEVGSGKTVVALRAMLRVVDSGGQAALLAPTEVLAQQHHRSITTMLGDLARGGMLGGDAAATRVVLLTGSMGAKARKAALLDIASGEGGIVIGTHALLQDTVGFADLGLVVVDEQHRFGVEQRAALSAKAEHPPHVLVMTATPIPRTVAITVFGDLETSTLRQVPAGRAEVQTSVVPTRARPEWILRAWERIREEVADGRQAYVVCSRIGDEPPPEDGPELHSVEELAPDLAASALAGLRVEMLHGRMAAEDKDDVMRRFAAGEVDVLVSTTVIEVGVDVPNASVMVILDAERFGVSQLHQLRGRIGRGGHAGLCLLVTGVATDSPSMERLVAVAATRDGFALSEVDLAQRREGDVLGTSQSGRRRTLQLLSVVDPRDVEVIEEARELATTLVAADPALDRHRDLAAAVFELEERADYLEMG